MLVAMLQHVFDPPPDRLAVPWMFLGGLGIAAVAGGLAAAGLVALQVRRLPVTDDVDTAGFWEGSAQGVLRIRRCVRSLTGL